MIERTIMWTDCLIIAGTLWLSPYCVTALRIFSGLARHCASVSASVIRCSRRRKRTRSLTVLLSTGSHRETLARARVPVPSVVVALVPHRRDLVDRPSEAIGRTEWISRHVPTVPLLDEGYAITVAVPFR